MHAIRKDLIPLMLLIGLTIVPASAGAAESYDNCTGFIDSLPATIATQGTWCVRQDLSTAITDGEAITVANNNVTIDCNEFKIGGLGAGTGTATTGIRADNRVNTTVRNCNIRGFLHGLHLTGGNHAVEDNRLDGNTYIGIYARGDGSVVQRNRVRNTGGSTVATGLAMGIYTDEGVDILDNTVAVVRPGADGSGNGTAFGIYTNANRSGRIDGNRLRLIHRLGSGWPTGIHNENSGRISVTDNHITDDRLINPNALGIGLQCASTHGRAEKNIIHGFAAGIIGCRDDGNSL